METSTTQDLSQQVDNILKCIMCSAAIRQRIYTCENEHLHCNGSDIDNEKWIISGGEWVRGSQGHGGEGYFLAEEEVATKL